MRRREFIKLIAGGAAAMPLAARAQERVRRIGVLLNLAADDPESSVRIAAFQHGLQELGWIVGHNVRIDYRWGAGDGARYRKFAAELVALSPDVILAVGAAVVVVQQATLAVPIVFVGIGDPVSAGLVASMARPGGNTTGFTPFEFGTSGKWLDLLKQAAPRMRQVAVLRDPTISSGIGQIAAIQGVASSLGAEVTPIDVRKPGEIERAIGAFAQAANGGLIVPAGALVTVHRELIIALAARHRLPAIYPYRFFVAGGGLMSYGPELLDQYRQAARYVDRILRGEKPADLPVQAPTKYELVINLKVAKALGLTVPASLLARADEVIE